LVGSPGFGPGSREPKSPSLDQASRRPLKACFRPFQNINEAIVKLYGRSMRGIEPMTPLRLMFLCHEKGVET
jgi:hypothetical protein